MIPAVRAAFNANVLPGQYQALLHDLELSAGVATPFRIAETPIFLPLPLLQSLADAGATLTRRLLGSPDYLAQAAQSIPPGFRVAGQDSRPHFLTADFALVQTPSGNLEPRLVEMQAFPSLYGFQATLADSYSRTFNLSLPTFLSGLNRDSYFQLLRSTVLGSHAPENVVLTEVDPTRQKTLPDFLVTARELGISIVDITHLVPIGRKLHYRNSAGHLIPIHRIYNRAIADEIIARGIQLPFDLEAPWEVEWAGHPNWYFLISKFAIPHLWQPGQPASHVIPPAVFLSDFLSGPGHQRLAAAGVPLPAPGSTTAVYSELLLKPLFSFAGKGIQFAPTHSDLLAIPHADRGNYLLQQRMSFLPTIETPFGITQAEIRILYLWPDGGDLTPAIPLIRLGRGKMMGVDHNRDLEWVGASAAFWVP